MKKMTAKTLLTLLLILSLLLKPDFSFVVAENREPSSSAFDSNNFDSNNPETLESAEVEEYAAESDFTMPLNIDPFFSMYDSDILVAEGLTEAEERIAIEIEMEMNSLYGEEGAAFTSDRNGRRINSSERKDISSRKKTQSMSEAEAEFTDEYRHDRYIVKYKSEESQSVTQMTRRGGVRAERLIDATGRIEIITLSDKVNPKIFADELKASGAGNEIEYIQPDYIMMLGSIFSEPSFDDEPDPIESNDESTEAKISMDVQISTDEKTSAEATDDDSFALPVTVAIIDTGIDSSHEMLAPYMIGGWNFINDTDVTYDPGKPLEASHGTHIAGTIVRIAAETGSDIRIMPLHERLDMGREYVRPAWKRHNHRSAHPGAG